MRTAIAQPGFSSSHRPLRQKMAVWAVWFAVASLLFHSLLPLAYQASMRRAGSPGADRAGFDSIVICTAMGMRTVKLGADGQPMPDAPGDTQPDSAKRYCPICLGAQMLPALLPPDAWSAALPLLASGIAFAMWMAAPPHGVDQAPARARGPPTDLD